MGLLVIGLSVGMSDWSNDDGYEHTTIICLRKEIVYFFRWNVWWPVGG